ncbi:MAG: phosphoenolpyruvate--protein phosphotransferase [Clostridiales bacterium]|nr:phosphoenolpyruvate--protein phosphotransferase [Clostridiales bacterium]
MCPEANEKRISPDKEMPVASAVFRGVGAGKGMAHGRLSFRHAAETEAAAADRHSRLSADAERVRFERSRSEARDDIAELERRAAKTAGEESAAIFEIHGMLLDDEDFTQAVSEGLADGLTAEAAVSDAGERLAAVFEGMEDEYLRARAADMRDVCRRVHDRLTGHARGESQSSPAIIVAPDLSPSETVSLDPAAVLGFVTFGGSRSSHTAILARQMGIPAVVMTGPIPDVYDGCDAMLDAAAGTVTVNPGMEELEAFADRERLEREKRERLAALAQLPAVTLSGRRIMMMANVGSPGEVAAAAAAGADGIGLFRSEFLYLGRDTLPDEEEQLAAYRKALDSIPGKPVIVRTLDIGADKTTPALPMPHEENPALGIRGVRFSLKNTGIFRTQLRALCRASAFGDLHVMLPMVVSADEVRRVRTLLREVQNELRFEEYPFDPAMPLGIMLETPAAALMCDTLAAECDFFSVGTNDLCQYTLAADRQNEALGRLIDENLEPVLRLIRSAAEAVHRAGGCKWIGVCGELAADTALTSRFLDAGVDELSVSVPYIAEVKEKIRAGI